MGRVVALVATLGVAAGTASLASAVSHWSISYVGGSGGVYVVGPDEKPRRIRAGHRYEWLAWSPNGRYLAFAIWRAGFVHAADGIYITSADGRELWRVTRTPGQAVWSPDGSKIAYSQWGGTFVVKWDGSRRRRVLREGGDITWAGSRLVCACRNRLLTVREDGSDLRVISHARADGTIRYVSASSDGRLIAFGRRCYTGSSTPSDMFCEIAVVSANGTENQTVVPYVNGTSRGPIGAPTWIPGSHRLIVERWGSAHGILRVDVEPVVTTTVRRDVGHVMAAASDGSFMYVKAGGHVLVCDARGRVLQRIRLPDGATSHAAAL